MPELAVILAGLALFAGGALQSATGFGFALAAAPLVFSATEPERAIWFMNILAVLVNVLTLATEGRRPVPLLRDSAGLLAWSVPGAIAGVAILRALDDVALQVVVTVAVLASLAVRRWIPHHRVPQPVAGASMGALNASTGTGGPPLVLYLVGRGLAPEQIRDTLGAVFLGSALIGMIVLAATGTGPLPGAGAVAGGAVFVGAGHLLGRRAFARLAQHAFEAVLVVVLIASLTGGLLRALG